MTDPVARHRPAGLAANKILLYDYINLVIITSLSDHQDRVARAFVERALICSMQCFILESDFGAWFTTRKCLHKSAGGPSRNYGGQYRCLSPAESIRGKIKIYRGHRASRELRYSSILSPLATRHGFEFWKEVESPSQSTIILLMTLAYRAAI